MHHFTRNPALIHSNNNETDQPAHQQSYQSLERVYDKIQKIP